MNEGSKAILMEDLAGFTQTGYFFGPGSPHNWGKDLDAVQGGNAASPIEMARLSFQIAAKIHALFWQDRSLLQFPWLRGCDWIQGEGEESFSASQRQALESWTSTKKRIAEGTSGINWDPLVIACVDSAFSKVSWDDFCSRQTRNIHWTLVCFSFLFIDDCSLTAHKCFFCDAGPR